MAVVLAELSYDNYDACVALSVADDQTPFVVPNADLIAQAKADQDVYPLVIMDGDTMVGFCMYGIDDEDGRHWILRLMVDKRYQGRGYARQTMQQLIPMIRSKSQCTEIYACYDQSNTRIAKLFTTLGFEKTSESGESGEPVYRLRLSPAQP